MSPKLFEALMLSAMLGMPPARRDTPVADENEDLLGMDRLREISETHV